MSSLTGTSSGTSAVRAPPLGITMVRFRSGIAFPPLQGSQMRHLAIASDVPAILVVQCMADLAFDHAARVVARHGREAVGALVLFVHCEPNGWMPLARTTNAPALGAPGPNGH